VAASLEARYLVDCVFIFSVQMQVNESVALHQCQYKRQKKFLANLLLWREPLKRQGGQRASRVWHRGNGHHRTQRFRRWVSWSPS